MAFAYFRLLWGHNPSWYDTDSAVSRGLWTSLCNVIIDPTGGYHNALVDPNAAAGAITFGGSPSATVNDLLLDQYDYAAKWPRFVPDGQHYTMGSRFWLDSNPGAITPIFLVLNIEGFCQMSLCVDTSGHLCAWRGLPDVVHGLHEELWNSGTPLSTGAWHRVGFWGLLAGVNGWFDVYLDSVHQVFISGKKTHVHDLVPWAGMGWGGTSDMKHSHLWMGSGVPFYDAKIRKGGFYSIPGVGVSDGAFTAWPSTEATIYQAIDDAAPDDLSTNIRGATRGNAFTVHRESVIGTRSILGVQQTARYLRTDDSAYALRQALAVDDVLYPANTIAADAAGEWAWDQPEVLLVDPSNDRPFTRARLNERIDAGGLVHGPAS